MSDQEDKHDVSGDEPFHKYLKRSSELSQQYKQTSQDEVPAGLDEKILLQARQAVSDKKVITHPSWWTKWNKPLALAATLLLAVTVVYKVGDRSIDKLTSPEPALAIKEYATDKKTPSSLADEASVTEEKPSIAPESSSPAKAEAKQQRNEPASLATSQNIQPPSIKQTLPATPPQISLAAPAAAPAAPVVVNHEMEKDKTFSAGALAKSAEQPKQETVDSIATSDVGKLPNTSLAESLQRVPGVNIPSSKERGASAKKEKPELDPEKMLQHIRELRTQGKDKEALKAWKQFRKSFPDYPVAEDDVARVN